MMTGCRCEKDLDVYVKTLLTTGVDNCVGLQHLPHGVHSTLRVLPLLCAAFAKNTEKTF